MPPLTEQERSQHAVRRPLQGKYRKLPGIAPVGLPNATAGPTLARNAADLARTNDAYDRAARARTGRACTPCFAAIAKAATEGPQLT